MSEPIPKVPARGLPWLERVYRYAAKYDLFRPSHEFNLRRAPSDVWDGLARPEDVADLVRSRIVFTLPILRSERIPYGSPVTWEFTDDGIALMRHCHGDWQRKEPRMSDPRFGNCRDCACWKDARAGIAPSLWRVCRRRPKRVNTHADDGCFDFIPKPLPSPPENENG